MADDTVSLAETDGVSHPTVNFVIYFYINILQGQRIGTVLNPRRANAPSLIAYFPVRASATALGNLYASIIAFPGTIWTNASPVTAYSSLLASVAGG